MARISKLISNKLLMNPSFEPLLMTLVDEMENDYYSSLKKSIGKNGLKWAEGSCVKEPSFPGSTEISGANHYFVWRVTILM